MKHGKKISILILIICFLFNLVQAESYNIIDSREYLIRNIYEIENNGINPVYNISIKVLVGANSNSPYQKRLDIEVNPMPTSIYTDDWGNTYANVDIKSLQPGEKIEVIIDKTIENSGISYDESLYKMNVDYREYLKSPFNAKYIMPGQKAESDAPEIKKKALEIAKTETVVEKAKTIYDFVNLHIDYDTNPKYANKGALSGLLTGRGVCDEYAFLFTALCRAAGIPSRVVAGYWIEGEIGEGVWNDVSSERHAWSEFYVPNIGWIPAEPTFMYTYNGERVPNEHYFANIKSSDRHFINNYIDNEIKSDIDVQYSYYESYGTGLNLVSKEESIKLLPKGTKPSTKLNLSDISSSWAREYIEKLYKQGIVLPKEGSLYKPEDNITREEFATYLVNVIGLEQIKSNGEYKDVSPDNPYAGYIATATKAGLIQGFNGYYFPNHNITRQDAAVIMERALDYLNLKKDAEYIPDFRDKYFISDYALDGVKLMYEFNIMRGRPDNIFAPRDFTSRAEGTKIIWSFMEVLNRL